MAITDPVADPDPVLARPLVEIVKLVELPTAVTGYSIPCCLGIFGYCKKVGPEERL
jgi:hypothetical protein